LRSTLIFLLLLTPTFLFANKYDDKKQIEKHSEFVERKNKTLKLKLKHKSLFLENKKTTSYYFLDHYKFADLFLISIHSGNHDLNYKLIDASTEKEYIVVSKPVFSPDKKMFITASVDLEARYSPTQVTLYNKSSDGSWQKVFDKKTENHGYKSPKWISNSKIELDKYVLDLKTKSFMAPTVFEKKVYLIKSKDKWGMK
jgi:hypothetical protein